MYIQLIAIWFTGRKVGVCSPGHLKEKFMEECIVGVVVGFGELTNS